MTTKGKVITSLVSIVILVFAGWFFFKFYFVFGEGVKSGELNYLVYKGYVFKTYEGKMIRINASGLLLI